MPARLNPYLNFRGTARDAMTFYHGIFGGALTISSFREMGMPLPDESQADWIMHAQIDAGDGWWLMGSDVPAHMDWQAGINTFSVSLSGDAGEETRLRGYWDKLSDGATITQPLEKAPWGDAFGMLTDRFGVAWLVNIGG